MSLLLYHLAQVLYILHHDVCFPALNTSFTIVCPGHDAAAFILHQPTKSTVQCFTTDTQEGHNQVCPKWPVHSPAGHIYSITLFFMDIIFVSMADIVQY